MKSTLFPFILIGLFSLNSCNAPLQTEKNTEEIHFDLISFTDALASQLENDNDSFQYKLTVNNEEKVVSKAEIDWEKEISFIKQADINKPILKGAYEINEQKSNTQEQVDYVAKSEKEKVRQLSIFKENNHITRIEAQIFEDLQLFSSYKSFWVQLDSTQALKAYHLESKEEILFLGNKLFTVSAQRQ
ncbi:hypothetical protein [Sediminitomix flava]|uniref:Uncharacterized protein n=1 Tax=Sediminitomix flava TaxID=379075 RepID=A0A316A4K1_SEDFL|nr:hypothetical protein [Sediminitomix flava]PWJ44677.1 hypothetical protein BC781_1011048 [Sediminitomix flava]